MATWAMGLGSALGLNFKQDLSRVDDLSFAFLCVMAGSPAAIFGHEVTMKIEMICKWYAN